MELKERVGTNIGCGLENRLFQEIWKKRKGTGFTTGKCKVSCFSAGTRNGRKRKVHNLRFAED